MEIATFWEQVRSALGFDEPGAAQAVAKATQVLLVALLTFWIATWVGDRIRRTARAGHVSVHGAALLSRAATLLIVAVAIAAGLAILGVNTTAVAAVLGAATLGISLAIQDVGRGFVTGLYILVERPFRVGDRIRVGATEGRVEDIGVRLTHLRTEGGDRISIPNILVFSGVLENATVGEFERQRYSATGIELAVAQIEDAVVEALRGAPHLSYRPPLVEIVESRPDGTDIDVLVEYDLGHRVDHQVIDQLRARFPEATVSARNQRA